MNIRCLLIGMFLLTTQSCFSMKKDMAAGEIIAGLVSAAHSNDKEKLMILCERQNDDIAHSKKDQKSVEKFIDVKNRNGDTPLHLSVQQDDVKLTAFLLSKDASINVKGEGGQTPLFRAIVSNCSTNMINLLLENRADPNIQDDIGDTCFSVAALSAPREIVDVLIEYEEQLQNKREEGHERSIVEQLGLAPLERGILYSLEVQGGCVYNIPLWKLSQMKKLQSQRKSGVSPVDASMITSQQLNLLSHAFEALAVKKFKLYYENLKDEYDVYLGDKNLGQGRLRKLINAAHCVGASKLSNLLLTSFIPREVQELYFPDKARLTVKEKNTISDFYRNSDIKDCAISLGGSKFITYCGHDIFHLFCNNKFVAKISVGRLFQGDMINQDESRMIYQCERNGRTPIKIYDLNAFKEINISHIKSINNKWVGVGKLSPKGFQFAGVTNENNKTLSLVVIDAINGQLIHKQPVPIPVRYTDKIMTNVLTWSPDEKFIVTACRNLENDAYLLFLYECENGTITEIFNQPTCEDGWAYEFKSVAFTPNGEKIIAVMSECIYILDFKTRAIVHKIENTHIFQDEKTNFSEGDITFSSDGTMCFLAQEQRSKQGYSSYKNYTILQINLKNGLADMHHLENRKMTDDIKKAIFTPNGLFLIVLDYEGVSFYRTKTGEKAISFPAQVKVNRGRMGYESLSINKKGDRLLLASHHGHCIYQLSTLTLLDSYENKLAKYR